MEKPRIIYDADPFYLQKGFHTVISHDIFTIYSANTVDFPIHKTYHYLNPIFGRMNLLYNCWAVDAGCIKDQISGWFLRCVEDRRCYEVYIIPSRPIPILITTEWYVITHDEVAPVIHKILKTNGELWRKFPEK